MRVIAHARKELLSKVRHVENVVEVSLPFMDIQDNDLVALGDLTQLEVLDLHNTDITDDGLVSARTFAALTVLDVRNTRISDEGIARLVRERKGLRHLALSNTRVTDVGVVSLAGLPGLETLALRGTSVTDSSVEVFARMNKLRRLNVDHTQISTVGRIRLSEMRPDVHIGITPMEHVGLLRFREPCSQVQEAKSAASR